MIVLTAALLIFCNFSSCVKIQQHPFMISREGDPSVTLECEQDDSQYYYMYWYRQNFNGNVLKIVAYSLGKFTTDVEDPSQRSRMYRPTMLKSSLQISSVEAADSAVYYCASRTGTYDKAVFGAGTKLTVLEKERNPQPPTVKVLQPSSKECKNQKDNIKKKTLVCVVTGFYPDHAEVTWTINGSKITDGVATDDFAQRDGKDYKMTSRLRVSRESWNTVGNNFTCIVSFYDGTKTIYPSNWVSGVQEEAVKGGEEEVANKEQYLRITQAAKLSYSVFIVKSSIYGAFVAILVWKLQGSGGKQPN